MNVFGLAGVRCERRPVFGPLTMRARPFNTTERHLTTTFGSDDVTFNLTLNLTKKIIRITNFSYSSGQWHYHES